MTGKERFEQVRTKARIIDRRNLRDYLDGKLDFLPASVIDEMMVKEFDRLELKD